MIISDEVCHNFFFCVHEFCSCAFSVHASCNFSVAFSLTFVSLFIQAYNGDDYNGARIVSRAHELRDSVRYMSLHIWVLLSKYTVKTKRKVTSFLQVHGMLSQMDPALVTFCDKIAAQGGPLQLPDDLAATTFPSIPVMQLGTVTRASARLRNVQPQLNLDQSYEALKRSKKNADLAHGGMRSKVNTHLSLSLSPHIYIYMYVRN